VVAARRRSAAGENIAWPCSLRATCGAPGINPFALPADVFDFVQDQPACDLDALLAGAPAAADRTTAAGHARCHDAVGQMVPSVGSTVPSASGGVDVDATGVAEGGSSLVGQRGPAPRSGGRGGCRCGDGGATLSAPTNSQDARRDEQEARPVPQMVFINLPITDVDRARAFYEGIGFSINPLFSDDNALCVVVSETIFLMVLKQEFFKTFISRPLADPATTASALIALSRDSKADVDAITAAAIAHGGSEPRPTQDLGFMYSRAFCDPDGNWFETMWMDPAAAQGGPPA
jgi:predicted lactoylglutathione lyase